jgi:hypothetical protein
MTLAERTVALACDTGISRMIRNLALHISSPSSHLMDMNHLRVHCAVLDPIRHLPSVQGPLFCHS